MTEQQRSLKVEAGPMPCGVVPCVLPMHDVNGPHLDPDGNEFTIDVCPDCNCCLSRHHRGDHRNASGQQFTRAWGRQVHA